MRLMILTVALAMSAPAAAHVTVWPNQSAPGAREKYELRVPNEKQVDTIAVEVSFPTGLKLTSFEQKPGWNTEVRRDASGAITGARWTGRLPPQQFTEFGLLAGNPASGRDLVWTAVQTYADGTKIEWSGPAGSKTPAPRVTLVPAR
jgi:YD repeat-containing protein